MSESKKQSFINFVVSESRKKDEQIDRLQDANDRQNESLRTMQKTLESIEKKLDASQKTIESSEKTIERFHTQLTTMGNTLKSVESKLKKSRRKAEKYKSLYEVLKTEKFSQTSQSSKYSGRSTGRDDEKDEWDGSHNDKETKVSEKEEVSSEDQSSDIAGKDTDCPSRNTQKKMDCPYRQGLKYDTMKVPSAVLHKCDGSRILKDDLLNRVEHICCLAHVRAKFQKALEQGGNERARKFVDWIGRLYKFEEEYKKKQLSPEEIKRRRNSAVTTSLSGNLWQKLTRLQDESIPKGDLMQKALNYFMHTRDSVMAYRHDGRYDIDNSVAERFIRPLTIERKHSLFFGSHKGVETSAVYHTFIATCQMRALSFCEFLKEYYTAVVDGRTDYKNLSPVLLG